MTVGRGVPRRDGLRLRGLFVLLAIVAMAGLSLGTASLASASTSCSTANPAVFSPTGAEQCFTLPAGATSVHVLAIGGPGGGATGGTGARGGGNLLYSDLGLLPGDPLFVNPGQTGSFNGGGLGGLAGHYFDTAPYPGIHADDGYTGGGASDVRTSSCDSGTCVGSGLAPLASRKLIA